VFGCWPRELLARAGPNGSRDVAEAMAYYYLKKMEEK
jgi:hypothetical protein